MDEDKVLAPDEHYEALQVAAKAVGGALKLLAQSSCDSMHMDEVLYMLARVLESPEVLT